MTLKQRNRIKQLQIENRKLENEEREKIKQLKIEVLELRRIIKELKNAVKCPYCLGIVVIKHGRRYTNKGSIQRFECLSCHRKFMIREDNFRYRHESKLIQKVLSLHNKGMTSRDIASQLCGNISHVTISRWITDFSEINKEKILNNYANQRC